MADLTREVVDGTLGAGGVDGGDIRVVHVGNAFGQLFTGQGHLGAMPATVREGLWDVPASRHQAACASGSIAILAAMADLRAGSYDSALVVGVELEKTVHGDVAAQQLGAAAWIGHEGEGARFLWPHMFSRLTDVYDERYGLDEVHLRAIAALNLANAKRNPLAQTRSWDVPGLVERVGRDDDVNPLVEGRLRRYDCSQVTDGAAGVVLVNDAHLRAHPTAVPVARIQGWGHRTVGLGLEEKLARPGTECGYALPHVRAAVLDAFTRAHVELADVDALETHDCFTMSEYLAIDHVGLTGPGESWKAIENGEIEPGGTLPINPSGGLIGVGHPVGASGVRMLLDATRQVSGNAGDYQLDDARTVATLNFGGSTSTVVSLVVGAAPAAA